MEMSDPTLVLWGLVPTGGLIRSMPQCYKQCIQAHGGAIQTTGYHFFNDILVKMNEPGATFFHSDFRGVFELIPL